MLVLVLVGLFIRLEQVLRRTLVLLLILPFLVYTSRAFRQF
jgi:hypothetical protein